MNDAALPWICKRDVEFAQLNENRIFLAYCPSKSGFVANSHQVSRHGHARPYLKYIVTVLLQLVGGAPGGDSSAAGACLRTFSVFNLVFSGQRLPKLSQWL